MPPDAAAAQRRQRPPVWLRLIAHDRGVAAAALALVVVIAWAWLLAHGTATDAHAEMDMGAGMAPHVWSPGYLLAAFAMWGLMMVAMMLPGAAPMILLHARVARRSGAAGLTAASAAAYVAVWLLFSAAAASAQAVLVASGLVAGISLALGDSRLAGGLLVAAGLYQLSPLKRACLDQCRSPLSFIMRWSRSGVAGAMRLGAIHGLYCLGCCWALMLLLFAGGVMNLYWIGALALVVAAEKLAPPRLRLTEALGALLTLAGLALVVAGG